jgi:hypothetical protein
MPIHSGLTDLTASGLPTGTTPLPAEDEFADPFGKQARLRQRGMLGAIIAGVFVLSFGLMWLLTGSETRTSKSPLPIRTNANGSGVVEATPAPGVRSITSPPAARSAEANVAVTPAAITPALNNPAVNNPAVNNPGVSPSVANLAAVVAAAPARPETAPPVQVLAAKQPVAQISGAGDHSRLRGERVRAPRARPEPAPRAPRSAPSRKGGAETDLENPYQ